jgi:hypothetical protein
MPSRTITTQGKTWSVFPSGRITQYDRDEFGLVFVSGVGADREVRVTRYSPIGTRSRERSRYSQPSDTSPEADYAK